MADCPHCQSSMSDDADFCGHCGSRMTAGAEPTWHRDNADVAPEEEREAADTVAEQKPTVPRSREAARLNTVPSWLGWLALPIALLTSIIGLGLYSYWAYRRGRREGVGLDPTAEPYDNFGWRVVGWGVAGFFPILGLYAVFHLPTICYKQGLRVGAREGTAFEKFTSLPALGAAFAGMVVVALAALFIAGLTLAIVEGDNGDEPIRVLAEYEDEFLPIIRDNNEANEPLAIALLSYYSCSTDVACAAAGDALVVELRRYRPALVDTIDRTRALGEPPNLYEEFTPKYLDMSELRLEAVDDLVEGWETHNDPLFIEGGNKWTEAGKIYFEIVEQLLTAGADEEEAYIDRMLDFKEDQYTVLESAEGGGQRDYSTAGYRMGLIAGRMAAMEPPPGLEEYHSLMMASAEKCAESLSLYQAALGDEDTLQTMLALLDECSELRVRAQEELDSIASDRSEDD